MSDDDIHDFQDKLFQEGVDTLDPNLRALLVRLFPDAKQFLKIRDINKQLKGLDCRVVFPETAVTLDFKFREEEWNDFLLEFEHRFYDGRTKVGWVADTSKICDYFLYIFKPTWTGWLLPRIGLQAAWRTEGWLHRFGEIPRGARNRDYETISCAVPIATVCAAVARVRCDKPSIMPKLRLKMQGPPPPDEDEDEDEDFNAYLPTRRDDPEPRPTPPAADSLPPETDLFCNPVKKNIEPISIETAAPDIGTPVIKVQSGPRPPHYDAKGRFINGDCHICGKSAGFGVGVHLLRNELGTWYCLEHWREWKATHAGAG